MVKNRSSNRPALNFPLIHRAGVVPEPNANVAWRDRAVCRPNRLSMEIDVNRVPGRCIEIHPGFLRSDFATRIVEKTVSRMPEHSR